MQYYYAIITAKHALNPSFVKLSYSRARVGSAKEQQKNDLLAWMPDGMNTKQKRNYEEHGSLSVFTVAAIATITNQVS